MPVLELVFGANQSDNVIHPACAAAAAAAERQA